MEISKLKKRDSSLDMIRIIAFISVISIHFFLNNEFYSRIVLGKRMYIAVLVRTLFMDCVPLFMILSGYLLNKKVLEQKYYLGITSTYSIYFFSSLACAIYQKGIGNFNITEFKETLLNFSAAPYSWYIEMYIGLYLLIPFLNIIYHNLETKRKKQVMILSFIFLTGIHGIINAKYKIIPTWWSQLYPITYYFIGAYISEFKPKISNYKLSAVLIINILVAGSFSYHMCYGEVFSWGEWSSWGSLFNAITAVTVFLLIKNRNTEHWNVKLKFVIKYIGSLCLGAYLVSWIFDTIFYAKLINMIPVVEFRFGYMPIMVVVIGICSLLLSIPITFISNQVAKGCNLIILKIVKSTRKKEKETHS